MTKIYSAKSIANYFLSKAELSPMKLQKLVYFAHGWHLALFEDPLIDEMVEAWEFGPVIPSLYHEFKSFGNRTIDEEASDLEWRGGTSFKVYKTPPPEDPQTIALLDRILEIYGNFSAAQLSNLSHSPGGPWDQVYQENIQNHKSLRRNQDIPDDKIKKFFKDQSQANAGK
jgi:uncharacterized phage-associated protein